MNVPLDKGKKKVNLNKDWMEIAQKESKGKLDPATISKKLIRETNE